MDDIITDAAYERVSDDKKKTDGDRRQDVTRQDKPIKDYYERLGVKNYKKYIDDGKSAYTEDINQRPGFKQLLNDCRRHFIKRIVVEDMTRFSRNLSMGLQWLKELGELGVQVVSLKEGELEVTSAKGWMQSAMLLMFSEWDSRIKSDKVRSGMQKAKAKGKSIGRPEAGKNTPTLPLINQDNKKDSGELAL